MPLTFSKYHGAQNDFLIIADQDEKFPINQQLIAALCHRKVGVGADGVLLLQRSEKADCRMRIFNADGGEAMMCGNGLRCLVAFAKDQGMRCDCVEVGTRVVQCTVEGEWITIDLGPYTRRQLMIDTQHVHLVDVGVPHAVVFVSDHHQVMKDVKCFNKHVAFGKEGANLNFAVFKEGKLYTRTFERGVGETAACGSGAAAVAIVAQEKYGVQNPVTIVPLSKEELRVSVFSDRVLLSGKATFVFHGSTRSSNEYDNRHPEGNQR